MVKKIALFLAVALAIVLAWWLQQPGNAWRERVLESFNDAPAPPKPRPAVLVELARAQSRLVQDQVQAVGSLASRQSVSLRAQTSGQITKVNFQDGARVRKSQLLVQQDDALQRAQLQQTTAELGLARANFQRNKELVAQGFISQQGLDESSAALQVQQARLSLGQTAVDRLQIKAPFDAVIGISSISVGDYLREGDEVALLQDMDVMYVDFRLPERYLPQVKVGMPVAFTVDALPGEDFTAHITAVDPLIDEGGRSLAVRASLPNPQHVLRPGMFARIQLVLAQRQHAVVVPEQAITPTEGGMQVIKVVRAAAMQTPPEGANQKTGVAAEPLTEGLEAQVEIVPLGTRLPGWVEVKQGIAVDDVVVVAGQQRISATGQALKAIDWPPAQADSAAAVAPAPPVVRP